MENENFQKLKEISKTKEAEKISYDPFISSCRVSGFYFKPQRCQKFSKKLLHFLNILNTLRNSAFPLRVALRRDIVLSVCLLKSSLIRHEAEDNNEIFMLELTEQ